MPNLTPKAKALPADFNARRYAAAYPDVEASGLTPQEHFLRFGKLLGRSPSPKGPDPLPVNLQNQVPALSAEGEVSPALLDLAFAQGPIPSDEPLRHAETVSILMPSYNNGDWIARAINSARSQTGVAIELIVVDDGSTDHSVQVARAIAAEDPRVKVVSLLRNFGCYYARNMALMEAAGDYVTIIDSDDIMTTDRLARQLDAIKASDGAIASRAKQRRWLIDYTVPVSVLRFGENTLLWPRSLLDQIGWYDTTRYSSDTEFRFRLTRTLGKEMIVDLPEEHYFLRALEGSLTMSDSSRIFTLEANRLQTAVHPTRQQYADNYKAWHLDAKQKGSIDRPFPQFHREYALGTPDQEASPSIGHQRVGAVASTLPDLAGLRRTVNRMLGQLDRLHVVLDGQGEVPKWLTDPRITVHRDGPMGAQGVLAALAGAGEAAYCFALETLGEYAPDYVARHVCAIEMLGRDCVTGVDTAVLDGADALDLPASTAATQGRFVDWMRLGTAAWHARTLTLDPASLPAQPDADAAFTAAVADAGVALFALPRAADWLALRDTKRPTGAPAAVVAQRRAYEAHVATGYDAETLAAARIALPKESVRASQDALPARRTVQRLAQGGAIAAAQPVRFHLIVHGRDAGKRVDKALRSIAAQKPGAYSYDVTLVDDGSGDGTAAKLAGASILPGATLLASDLGRGPAHGFAAAMAGISDGDSVVVDLALGDILVPDALRRLAQVYADGSGIEMTLGAWQRPDGTPGPNDRYGPDDLRAGLRSGSEILRAPPLRSFRRALWDRVDARALRDPVGDWCEAEAALVLPLLEACNPDRLHALETPLVIRSGPDADQPARVPDWMRGPADAPSQGAALHGAASTEAVDG